MRLPTRPLLRLLLLLVLLTSTLPAPALAAPAGAASGAGAGTATAQDSPDPVKALMAQLTPDQKVGQLFLTTFVGPDAGSESDIARLIAEQRIGGVILSSVNMNFANNAETPTQIATLVNALQQQALQNNGGVPLFVALDHEGDGYPYTRVTGGMTPLPNPMAIGATWKPENAEAVGEIVGRELAALGFNLLLGPDVDVLYNPRPLGRGDIGTRTFGGDPWWVAEMGLAYICGVHTGSEGRLATVAKHFPGHGGSDRLPDREIATVDKSLTELKRIELPPFFAATNIGQTPDCGVTDAMMTSHIRYRGLQGNIRQFTAPISFDAEGLGSILGLSEFDKWRAGGLVISDALGVPAVAKYFDPTEKTFPHRQVAKEALMAGNDLLSIDQFSRPQAAALQTANLADTVAYFREEYATNPQFHDRVEEAVERVLRVKLKIYQGQFDPARMSVAAAEAPKVTGQGAGVVSQIAREAITLLYPVEGSALPPAPRRDENIVVFTDSERVKDCRDCEWYEALPVTGVQDAILKLYGPGGTGQVDPERITSVGFNDLRVYLTGLIEASQAVTPTTPPITSTVDIGALVDNAKWIILAMRNADRDTNSEAVRLFLDNSIGRVGDKRLVVFAFNAPYYLDTTEISKLDLYLAAYSKTAPFIEAAARALFGEFQPTGHSPVNIEGLNYDLLRQLAPDPAHPIPLEQIEPASTSTSASASGESMQAPVTVRFRAGPLVDRNGNQVPDGTEVLLEANYEGSNQFVPAATGVTAGGMVELSLMLRQAGNVLITARAGDAAQSRTLRLTVVPPPSPTPLPTPTPSITPRPTRQPTARPTLSPAPTASATLTPPVAIATPAPPQDSGPSTGQRARVLGLALAGTLAAGMGGWLWLRARQVSQGRRVRWVLLCLTGGMTGYIVYLLAAPEPWQAPMLAPALAFIGGLACLPAAAGREEKQPAAQA